MMEMGTNYMVETINWNGANQSAKYFINSNMAQDFADYQHRTGARQVKVYERLGRFGFQEVMEYNNSAEEAKDKHASYNNQRWAEIVGTPITEGTDENKSAKEMGATVTNLESEQEIKARDYYYKLWKCLKRAMSDDKLACHCNNIIVHLGKSIESNYTYYNGMHDAWCDYFLK